MSVRKTYDYIIFGAGMYGLYMAYTLSKKYPKKKIVVLEHDAEPFSRASYINQARVHNGYHYPRSLATAMKSAQYYQRFLDDFSFAINSKFKKIYAVAEDFSVTSPQNFVAFCKASNIPYQEVDTSQYFKSGIAASFETDEYSFDAAKIKSYLFEKCQDAGVTFEFNFRLKDVKKSRSAFTISSEQDTFTSAFVVNATYASVNQVLKKFGFDLFSIKYEIAEICLCTVSRNIEKVGLTVMDGPFFSVMPFGLSGYHSLSAVHSTPHQTSKDALPTFSCQLKNKACSPKQLDNCNSCPAQPKTAWNDMVQLTNKFINDDISMKYHKSLFAIKPIMKVSEIDDSRPTVIKKYSDSPTFYSVLSGKINTMYDLDTIV